MKNNKHQWMGARYDFAPRTAAERFRDSYAMLRVALARLVRGDRLRLKTLFN